jgi:hypothetical protein
VARANCPLELAVLAAVARHARMSGSSWNFDGDLLG